MKYQIDVSAAKIDDSIEVSQIQVQDKALKRGRFNRAIFIALLNLSFALIIFSVNAFVDNPNYSFPPVAKQVHITLPPSKPENNDNSGPILDPTQPSKPEDTKNPDPKENPPQPSKPDDNETSGPKSDPYLQKMPQYNRDSDPIFEPVRHLKPRNNYDLSPLIQYAPTPKVPTPWNPNPIPSESMHYNPSELDFTTFNNIEFYDNTNGFFSIGSANADARKRTLQNILCSSQNKFYCFNKYPAEVIGDLATVSIIYSSFVYGASRTPLLYEYTKYFQDYMQSFGISTCLLESTASGQQFVMTQPNAEPHQFQVKNNQKFFKRENLLNVVIKKLLKQTEWQIFAWIDAHQAFTNSYWWEEVIIKANKVGVLHLFQRVIYHHPNNQTAAIYGYGSVYELDLLDTIDNLLPIEAYIHGNAWAISRDMYERIGHIYDEGICGNPDMILSLGARNRGRIPYAQFQADNYFKTSIPWLKMVEPIFNDKGSSIRGTIRHFDHERTFDYFRAIQYVRANYQNKSLLDAMHREEDFTLILDDPDFHNYLWF